MKKTIYRVEEYRSNSNLTDFWWEETNLSACGPADEEKGGFPSEVEAMSGGCNKSVTWCRPENDESEILKAGRGKPQRRWSIVAVATRCGDQWRAVKIEEL